MLRTIGASHWRSMTAALAMLGLSACNSGSDTTARTADAASTGGHRPVTGIRRIRWHRSRTPTLCFGQKVGDTVLFATDHYRSRRHAHSRSCSARRLGCMQYAEWKLTVQGYADERGTREYNLALGERRAETVRGYLEALGVRSGAPADHLLWQGTARLRRGHRGLLGAEPARCHRR